MCTWHARYGTRIEMQSIEIHILVRNKLSRASGGRCCVSSKKTLSNWTCFISTSITTQFVIHYVEQHSNMCGIDCWRMWNRVRAALYTCNALCPFIPYDVYVMYTIQHSYIHLCSPFACHAVPCRTELCICHPTFPKQFNNSRQLNFVMNCKLWRTNERTIYSY